MHRAETKLLEVLKNSFYDWNSLPLIKEINIASRDNSHAISGSDLKWSKIPIYPECQTLDLIEYFD